MINSNSNRDFRLKLKSDFREMYYDYYFDREGVTFERLTESGPSRPEMVSIFKEIGLHTPLFGKYEDFIQWGYSPNKWVVVYTDINKHCGEGKERKLFGRLDEKDKELYLMEYIDTISPEDHTYYSKSTRFLMIGQEYCFVYDYTSTEDWRSNCGDGDITEVLRRIVPVWRKYLDWPLVAVDFVSKKGQLLAIDLNCSPGITGIKLNKYISGQGIVDSFKKWYMDKMYYEI